jgi:hypothetical protein
MFAFSASCYQERDHMFSRVLTQLQAYDSLYKWIPEELQTIYSPGRESSSC